MSLTDAIKQEGHTHIRTRKKPLYWVINQQSDPLQGWGVGKEQSVCIFSRLKASWKCVCLFLWLQKNCHKDTFVGTLQWISLCVSVAAFGRGSSCEKGRIMRLKGRTHTENGTERQSVSERGGGAPRCRWLRTCRELNEISLPSSFGSFRLNLCPFCFWLSHMVSMETHGPCLLHARGDCYSTLARAFFSFFFLFFCVTH